jgi:hypothetical protein
MIGLISPASQSSLKNSNSSDFSFVGELTERKIPFFFSDLLLSDDEIFPIAAEITS